MASGASRSEELAWSQAGTPMSKPFCNCSVAPGGVIEQCWGAQCPMGQTCRASMRTGESSEAIGKALLDGKGVAGIANLKLRTQQS